MAIMFKIIFNLCCKVGITCDQKLAFVRDRNRNDIGKRFAVLSNPVLCQAIPKYKFLIVMLKKGMTALNKGKSNSEEVR